MPRHRSELRAIKKRPPIEARLNDFAHLQHKPPEERDPDKRLTAQQREFCKLVAEGYSASAACQRVYKGEISYGYKLMRMPNIKREIAKYQEEYRRLSELTKKDVLDMLKESYEMAKLMNEPATMVSAARELGKLCGFYEPTKVQVDLNNTTRVKFEQLSDAELFAMIEKASRDMEAAEMQALEHASDDVEDEQ